MGGISKKANGDNQTQVKTSAGIWTADYNAQNRPVRFTRENADGTRTVITAAYDDLGRRAWKKVETIPTDPETGEETAMITLHQRYIYRGYLQVAACDLTRGSHPCLWLITWDPTQPIATRPLAIQKDGTWYCYGWDLTKNVCEVFGQAGYIRTTYSYTPYGSVTEEGDVTQPLQWSSEYADLELGLVYYNYRSYNPTDGRWNRRDPLGDLEIFNRYLYGLNRPSALIDILGLYAKRICKKDRNTPPTCHIKTKQLMCVYKCECPEGYIWIDLGTGSEYITRPCTDPDIITSGTCRRSRRRRMHRVVETAPSYERKMIEEYRQHTSQIGASATIFGGIVITLMFMLTGSKVPAI